MVPENLPAPKVIILNYMGICILNYFTQKEALPKSGGMLRARC
jgi:hypothetical protein